MVSTHGSVVPLAMFGHGLVHSLEHGLGLGGFGGPSEGLEGSFNVLPTPKANPPTSQSGNLTCSAFYSKNEKWQSVSQCSDKG